VDDLTLVFIERVLERGERIELLVDKTDNLNQQAFAFKKRSTQLKVKVEKHKQTAKQTNKRYGCSCSCCCCFVMIESYVVEEYQVDVHDCVGMFRKFALNTGKICVLDL
jgi:hypothetical protein